MMVNCFTTLKIDLKYNTVLYQNEYEIYSTMQWSDLHLIKFFLDINTLCSFEFDLTTQRSMFIEYIKNISFMTSLKE